MATTEPLEIAGLVVPAEDRTLAESIVKAIRKSGSVRLEADGMTFVVPGSAAQQIVSILSLNADNVPTAVIPATSELTVSQAAHFLGISEAHVAELLNCGTIEFRQDGENRMVLQDSLMRFDTRKKQGMAGMREIIRLSEEMGLYDDE